MYQGIQSVIPQIVCVCNLITRYAVILKYNKVSVTGPLVKGSWKVETTGFNFDPFTYEWVDSGYLNGPKWEN